MEKSQNIQYTKTELEKNQLLYKIKIVYNRLCKYQTNTLFIIHYKLVKLYESKYGYDI